MYSLLLLLSLSLLFIFDSVSAQEQCDPAQYKECGKFIEEIGYAETCDTKTTCRDCIGCNQACPWAPCSPDPTCS